MGLTITPPLTRREKVSVCIMTAAALAALILAAAAVHRMADGAARESTRRIQSVHER